MKVLNKNFRVGRSRTGLGLFATLLIEKGQFIIRYDGLRIPSRQAHGHPHARYLFRVNSRWTIDGSPRWNIARYINHSCRPNAEALEVKGRIKIRAKKRIKADEEITYHYGKKYFDLFIDPVGCKCAACMPTPT